MRLGIFGGTFDPVHYGHLLLAETCREQLDLEAVWFLPTAVPPHKQAADLTSGQMRIEMLELAIGGHSAFSVCSFEVERGGVNYTVDTLEHLARQDPARELFFLLGGDSLRDLPTWKEPARLCQLAQVVVVERTHVGTDAGGTLDLAGLEGALGADQLRAIRLHRVGMPRIDLTSSDIRRRAAEGRSIRYRTPRAVEKYIETHSLYRATSG